MPVPTCDFGLDRGRCDDIVRDQGVEHLVVRRSNPSSADDLNPTPSRRLHHNMIVSDGGVLQRVTHRAADQQIDPQSGRTR